MAQALDEKVKEQEALLEVAAAHVGEHSTRFDDIDAKLVEHDRRFDAVEAKLTEHDHRFDTVAAKLVEHDGRFDIVEAKLTGHDEKFDQIVEIIQDIRKDSARTHSSLERIEKHLRLTQSSS